MFKFIISITCIFLSLSHAHSKVQMRWLTVASIVLEDEETKILFDPMYTRASWKNWLNLGQMKSDEALVKKVLDEQGLQKLDAIFASHSHYDHVIDAPIAAKLTGGIFYVDSNSERIAKAYKDPKIKMKLVQEAVKIQIGKFTIIPLKRSHPPIRLINFDFLTGPVPTDFNFGFYDYHVGDNWLYYIEHPNGKILMDQGSGSFPDKVSPYTNQVNILIQGIANRESDEAFMSGYLKVFKPSIFVPVHFDNFISEFNPKGPVSYMPGMKIEELLEKVKKQLSQTRTIEPHYGEKIELLK